MSCESYFIFSHIIKDINKNKLLKTKKIKIDKCNFIIKYLKYKSKHIGNKVN
jgi:hypothetical protein